MPDSRVAFELGVVETDHAVRPVEDLVAIFLRHAHQLGDGLQRQLGRDVDDEVAFAALDDVVDDESGLGAQTFFDQSDHAGGEALVDQKPVPRVPRRVHVEHHLAHHVALGSEVGDA